MKTKTGLLLLLILIINMGAGFAQGVQQVNEFPNLVKNGDFENGPTGFKSDFINHESNDVYTWGYYVITDNVAKYLAGGVFVNPVPYTGKYYAIDMNNMGKQRLWYDSVTVKPNTTYSFSCMATNVNNEYTAPGVMNLKVNGKAVCPSRTLSNGSNAWMPLTVHYKTGPQETRVEIAIVDEIWTLMGNDVALDNIIFKEIPPEEYNTVCEAKQFPKLSEADKGVVKDNNTKVIKAQTFVKEERKKDSIRVEQQRIDSVEKVVIAKQKVIEKRRKDSIDVVVAIQKEIEKKKADSIAVVVEKRKADSVAVVVEKRKADSVAVVAMNKPKDPVVKKDPVQIKIDPVIIKKDPVVVVKKDPIVITPKDPVIIKKDPVVVKKDPVVVKKKPTEPIKFTKDISDEDLQEGVKLEMGHIYFDQGKAHLQDASKVELDELVALMKKHPKLRIRLEGHTTNDGNPQKNIILSEDRVKEVKKYLVEKGIAESRVEWIGYGGSKPLNSGSTPELKKLNRRVEVEIIESSK
jgi:outer membrane protein OmpA-like peptidoglycan-associated protein